MTSYPTLPAKLLVAFLAAVSLQSIAGHQSALGQVVQLPSFRSFSYTGSAWVPDGGTTSLGGTRYSTSGSTSRGWGPYGARASGGTRGGSSLSATVQIIDLQALDDAILSANVSRDPNAAPVVSAGLPTAAGGGRSVLSGLGSEPYQRTSVVSADPNQWQRVLSGGGNPNELQESQIESDIRYYLRMGHDAEKANRILASRVYYRMAIQAMTPEMVERYQQIMAERKEAEEAKRKADAQQSGRRKF